MLANDRKEQAKAAFIRGESISEIERMGIASRRTIQRWMKSDAEAGHDWEVLRDSLPEPTPKKPTNLVSFDRPRQPTSERDRLETKLERAEYDTLKGQIAAIDELLDFARVEAASPASPQTYGAALNAFSKLLNQRNQLKPIDVSELIAVLLDRSLTPRELYDRLKEAGWGRKRA